MAKTLNSNLFKRLNFHRKLNPENGKSVLVYTDSGKTARYGRECPPFPQV